MLELQNVSFAVAGEQGQPREILHDVSLRVPEGRFVVITGPNGSGKTTMARLIMGIEKPSSGRILFNGQDISQLGVSDRAKLGISFAFQQPVRFKGLTVADLISLAAGGENMSTAEICEYLSEVGLCARDYIDREVDSKLSGGELKRIEIATVLARGSRLSLFDEPEAGIDLWSFNNLIEVFANMRRQKAASIVVISHQERILAIADEIVVFADGRIARQGSQEEILPTLLNVDYKFSSCKGGLRNV